MLDITILSHLVFIVLAGGIYTADMILLIFPAKLDRLPAEDLEEAGSGCWWLSAISMEKRKSTIRSEWKKKVEDLGFSFHSMGGTYWDESSYFHFSSSDVEKLENATNQLFELCLEAVQHVINQKLYSQFHIHPDYIPFIEHSWNDDHPTVYGRFDLVYGGTGEPKMLEFNADTPTSLFESSVVQWYWLEDIFPGADQFNSIHEKLLNQWKYVSNRLTSDIIHFTCLKDNEEDLVTVEYLRDCAIQAGLNTKFIYLDDVGWDHTANQFIDLENISIHHLFKLYPWEWLLSDSFAPQFLQNGQNNFWIEPPWKMLLSNKAILPLLWKLFPDHPNLLPAYFEPALLNNSYVQKPFLSREGENIQIIKNGQVLESSTGNYGKEGFIYQAFCPLPQFDGSFPVIGSWIIGSESAGIGIRETKTYITDNLSRFIPHTID